MADEMGTIGFNAGKARKRAARMLAAKLDFADLTDLMKWLIDQQVEKYFPDEAKSIRLEENAPSPKVRGERKHREPLSR
mgnify:CR=1 FL=1